MLLIFIFNVLSAQKIKKLGIEFENITYAFGDVQVWENQPAIFKLTNTSKSPISILPLFSQNDLEIIYPDNAIQPGETAIIKAIYYTAGTGPFSKKFIVYFNISPEPFELKITGNIKTLSPTAYIQCPTAKPETSKPKLDLVGNVGEWGSELPLEGAEIKIIALTSKLNNTYYADKNGNFTDKVQGGNYEIFVTHPNYESYQGFFFLGQNTGYVKVRLKPIEPIQEVILTSQYVKEELSKEPIPTKQTEINSVPKVEESKPTLTTTAPIAPKEIPANKPFLKDSIPTENLYTKQDKVEQVTSIPSIKPTEPIQVAPTKVFQIQIFDKNTLEPVGKAAIQVVDPVNKKNNDFLLSDEVGKVHFNPISEAYRFTIDAENYFSFDTFLPIPNHSNTYLKIYLSPITNLFEAIYTSKKPAESNSLLEQLSFGKTDFEFAEKPENSENPPIVVEENWPKDGNLEAPKSNQTNEMNPKPTLNVDSIQSLLAQLLAEKEQLAAAYEESNQNLEKKNEELLLKQEEIDRKNNALEEQNKIIELSSIELQKEKALKDSLEMLQTKNTYFAPTVNENPELSRADFAANNVVFLIDVSSSMGKENKIDLLKESIKNLVGVLRDIDRVAIIAYNQKSSILLESVSGDNKSLILQALDSIQTSGLTYGVTGLQNAYDLLSYYYIGDGNNQIILATDGLFSSANTTLTESELNKEVRNQANDKGIKLSVIGFGQDETGKKLMQKLALNGAGQFIQINNPWEAKTVLIEEIKLNSKIE